MDMDVILIGCDLDLVNRLWCGMTPVYRVVWSARFVNMGLKD